MCFYLDTGTPICFFGPPNCTFLSLVENDGVLVNPYTTLCKAPLWIEYWMLCVSVNGLQTFSLPFSPNEMPSRGIHNFHLEVMKVSFLRMQSLSIWDCSVTSCLLHYATNSQCLVSWTCWRCTHQILETLERTTTTDVLEQIKASMSLLPPATQVSQQTLEYRNSFNWFIVPESFSVGCVYVQVGALFEKPSVSESDSFRVQATFWKREDLLGSYLEGAHYIETWLVQIPKPRNLGNRCCWCTDLLMVVLKR